MALGPPISSTQKCRLGLFLLPITVDAGTAKAITELIDPYTLVLGGLWEALRDQTEIMARVRPKNMITFTGDLRAPIKDQVSDADLPEIRIILSGSRPGEHGSSNTTFDTAVYEIQVSSGDQRLDHQHLPLKWAIFRAMRRALAVPDGGEGRLQALRWNEKRFVVDSRAVAVTEGVSQADLDRGIKGWFAVWSYEVKMFFATVDL